MNILTFDIEDWFHIKFGKNFNTEKNFSKFPSIIEKNLNFILNTLDDNNINATFFSLGWVAKKYPELIKKIDNRGHELGTHSHLHNLLHHLNRKEFVKDLNKSVLTIEDIIGKKVKYFRAPAFSINNNNLWVIEELINNGIEIDSSFFSAKRDYGGIKKFNFKDPFIINYNGIKIKEFPINYLNFFSIKIPFSGGGYFRFFPYNILNILYNNSNYTMSYFHPRDFEPNQPILDGLNFRRKILSYYGLKNSKIKFVNLLDSIKFISIKQANEIINWNKTKILNIE